VEAKGACTAVHFGRSGSCWARLGHLEIAMLIRLTSDLLILELIKWVYGYPDVSRGKEPYPLLPWGPKNSVKAGSIQEPSRITQGWPCELHEKKHLWKVVFQRAISMNDVSFIWLSSVLNGVVLCKQWSKSDSCGCSQGPVCFRLDLWLVQIVQMVQFGSLWFPVVYPGLCQATSMSRGLTLNLF
jgi:hypothetical protein